MPRTAFSRSHSYNPRITSDQLSEDVLAYVKGFNSASPNDAVPDDQLTYASDARISSTGRYSTRQGANFYSVALGQTQDTSQTSTSGAADKTINETSWLAAKFTAGTTGRLTRVDVRLKNASTATGTVMVKIYSDSSGSPGTLLATSSIASADITSSYQYLIARFIEAPVVASGTSYWLISHVQANGTNTYSWSSTTNATTAKSSADSGASWSTTTHDLNFKTYVSTNSPVLGLYRTRKSDGSKKNLIAHGTNLYTITDLDGTTSSIKSGLSASATKYRFAQVNDVVYYVNGFDAPRKWDYTTESAVGGSPAVATNIIQHKGLMFYVDAADPNKIFYSNFADYETFTSTDFFYVPAPKTADPITALGVLNDALTIWTRQNKYTLFGSDNSTFQLTQSPGRKGTFTQESMAYDLSRNVAYFLSDDGIYETNGNTDKLLSAPIDNKIQEILESNPANTVLGLHNNRLYVFYTPSGESANSKCLVYNLNYECWESEDTATYFNHVASLFGEKDEWFLGSSLVGASYYGEKPSNDYDNLGKPLSWEIRTKYMHWKKPSIDKEVRQWVPRFLAQSDSYNVTCQYDTDFRNSPSGESLNVQGVGETWGGGALFGDGSMYGREQLREGDFSIPGQYGYIQIRYKHEAARQPIDFMGHYLRVQVRKKR